jgi:pimeloyl-ACP methyl ester carboxylesterase
MNGGLRAINGIQMFYEIRGQGSPLVLLHGFTGSSADWKYIYPAPPEGFRLIIPDLRGHGHSTNPTGTFTHRQATLDVFSLLDDLGIQQFNAMGISAGGNILLHMATQQPERPRAMILISATTHFPEQARTIMGQVTSENRSDVEWEFMRKSHKYGDEQIRSLWRQANAFKDSYDDLDFTPSTLSTIRAKTLIVHGDRDPFYPITIPAQMASSIKDSHLWIIPGGGHSPVFGPMVDCFCKIASAFFHDELDGTRT